MDSTFFECSVVFINYKEYYCIVIINKMAQQTEKIKKPKGGARPGGGRKLLYGEKTMMVGLVIPISKENDFWNHVSVIKQKWLNEVKKVS